MKEENRIDLEMFYESFASGKSIRRERSSWDNPELRKPLCLIIARKQACPKFAVESDIYCPRRQTDVPLSGSRRYPSHTSLFTLSTSLARYYLRLMVVSPLSICSSSRWA